MRLSKIVISLCMTTSFVTCAENIGVISILKSGTHLVLKVVRLLTNKQQVIAAIGKEAVMLPQEKINEAGKDKILLAHLLYNEYNLNILQKNNYKSIFIFRDPRDQIISHVYWIYKNIHMGPQWKGFNFNQVILELIQNNYNLVRYDINKYYNQFLPWQNAPFVYTTTFERLVGPLGGGSLQKQLQEIQNIASHLGISITLEKAREIASKLFGNTLTFRQGQIGSWKKHFTVKQKEAFKKTAGQLLIDLGYEEDLKW